MAMTRKHYVEIAEIIAKRLDDTEDYADTDVVHYEINNLATSLIRMFKRDNPKFDVSRFREAAGLTKPGRYTPDPF